MKFLKLLSFFMILAHVNVFGQVNEVKVIKYEELFSKINQPTDQLIAVNFWATWCGPCVEEIPHFNEIVDKYKDNENLKVLFVSMDRLKQLEKVNQFVKSKNMNAEVVLLDDNKRMNEWIPAIDKSWSGNIPVTAFYKNGQKVHFVNSEMNKEEFETIINSYLN